MKLLYISRARIPSRKAHVTQILKMCDAFQDCNVNLELLHPWRYQSETTTPEQLKKQYNLNNAPNLSTLPALDLPFLKFISLKLWFYVLAFTYLFFTVGYLLFRRIITGPLTLYSRDRIASLFLGCLNTILDLEFYCELHELPGTMEGPLLFFWKKASGFIVLNQLLKDELMEQGIPEEKIKIAPDAVDFEKFSSGECSQEIINKLNISENRTTVGYTGHLYEWKGSETILELASIMPEVDFITVGGLPEQVKDFKQRAEEKGLSNLKILPHQPHSAIPDFLACFDVLLLPTQGNIPLGKKYTSPLKLFEYLAAGKPIVASDLPSIREILTDSKNSLLAQPADPQSFKENILRLMNEKKLANSLGKQAQNIAREYSWKSRAKNIKNIIF